MANTAASLGSLLCTNADLNYYTQQLTYWSNKYEANAAKLGEQVKYEEKWEDAFDDAIGNTKQLKAGDVVVGEDNQCENLADRYAHAKVKHYDKDLSLEFADLDIEYDTMKTMFETIIEIERAQQQSEKELVSKNAAETGLIGQG